MTEPFVSIIIPMRNEGDHIRPCIEAVLAQDYPAAQTELFIIDGCSTDNSRDVVAEYARQHPNLHLLDNPQQNTPAALNVGIKAAKGKYIVRVDAHTVIAPDYVRQCANLLEASGAANVGGRMQPVGQNYVGQAVALSTTSPFGIGNSKFHYDTREQYVDTVYMGAFRRDIFEKAGLFDEELIRNQDYELNIRIRQVGGEILLSPKIISHYIPRGTLATLWRQYFQYGRWKVRTLQKHPNSIQWRQAVAPLFVATILVNFVLQLFLKPFRWLFALVFGSYLLANLLASTIAACKGGWKYIPVLPIVFATIHFAWGVGFWQGVMLALLPQCRK